MFLKPLHRFLRTAGFKLTVWYSGIFIFSSLLLFSLTYFILSSSLHKQDREGIYSKLKELSSFYQTGGIKSLERQVSVRKKFERQGSFFVRVADESNRTLFLVIPYQWVEFDIKALERKTQIDKETWFYLHGMGSKNRLEIASAPLGDHYFLQVGKSTGEREKILERFREIFATVLLPLIICGFGGGAFLGYRAFKPVRHLIDTTRSVSAGRMDARVPNPHTGDELEALVELFNDMLARINSLIQAMRGSLDNLAHDLRTPMTRLRGVAERALQAGPEAGAYEEALVTCIEESDQILRMLNTFMDISEAETGAMKLDRRELELGEVAQRVLELYRYLAEEKNIQISVRITRGLSLVADPSRIGQVLANLVDNAIKYTPENGRVDIEAYKSSEDIIISVKDTGSGISREDLPRIWDRLYRGDQSRSQRGLGLGLSLVKAIVAAHGGKVQVNSEPGRGSTFTITIPAGA